MDIAERIRFLRKVYDISAAELGDITGIHPVSIRKYETHKMVPGMDIIDKMCEALSLPRMVFEGMPPQYTNYENISDFYQQLLLLMDNGTLLPDSRYERFDTLSLNPLLGNYIQIKHGDTVIPLDDLTITINPTSNEAKLAFLIFQAYARSISNLSSAPGDILEPQEVDILTGLPENSLEKNQLELMLFDHSIQHYVDSFLSRPEMQTEYQRIIREGGNYYTFVKQLDVPESVQQLFIEAYESRYLLNKAMEEYFPWEGTEEEQLTWTFQKGIFMNKYKTATPDYHNAAMLYAVSEAEAIRRQNTEE